MVPSSEPEQHRQAFRSNNGKITFSMAGVRYYFVPLSGVLDPWVLMGVIWIYALFLLLLFIKHFLKYLIEKHRWLYYSCIILSLIYLPCSYIISADSDIIIPSFFYCTKIINSMRFYIWYYLSKNFANFYLSNSTRSKKFFLQSVTCNSVFCVGVVHQISDLKLIQVYNIKFFILD